MRYIPVLVVVAVLGGFVFPASVGAQSLAISLTINGDSVQDGDAITVSSESPIQIDVTADVEVESVVVRVNGATRKSFSPNAKTFSETVSPTLKTGSNEIRVIAKGVEGSIDDVTITVLKDNRRPVVEFTSPFVTDGSVPNESYEVDSGFVTIAGEIKDHTRVESGEINRRYRYYYAGDYRIAPQSYDINDPSGSFSKKIFLGNGTNLIDVSLRDRAGNMRTYEFKLFVLDETKPSIDVTSPPEKTNAAVFTLEGEISDNVQLDTVKVQRDGGSQTILNPSGPQPDPKRARFAIQEPLELHKGSNDFKLIARDTAGNTVSREFDVTFEPTVAPTIKINEAQTAISEDGKLTLNGTVRYGEITSVSVEAINEETGDPVDLIQVYSGDEVRNAVALSDTIRLARNAKTRIEIRATDTMGDETVKSFQADPSSGSLSLGLDVDAQPAGSGSDNAQSETNIDGTSTTETARGQSANTVSGSEQPGSNDGSSTDRTGGSGSRTLPVDMTSSATATLLVLIIGFLTVGYRFFGS